MGKKLGVEEAAELREEQLALMAVKMNEPPRRRGALPTAAERERRLALLQAEEQIDGLKRAAEAGMHVLVFQKWAASNRSKLRALGAKIDELTGESLIGRGRMDRAALMVEAR